MIDGYIYKTTNISNSMFYIGQHIGNNFNYLGSGINRAIKKYGIENFKKEIICYVDDKEQANIMEYYHIREHRNKFGRSMMYNIADGGEGGDLFTSNPNKEKIRLKWIGKKRSQETKEKMRKAQTGKHASPETIEKMKKVQTNHPVSEEQRKKISKTLTGHKHSKETIKKMSKSRSPEHCENIRIARLGKVGNKLKKYLLILLLPLLFGCASQMYTFKEGYNRAVNPPTDWNQQAELYTETYPDCSNNQKALMLAADMRREGCSIYTSHKTHKIHVIYIYQDGKQIWPVKRHNTKLLKLLR